MEFSKDKEVVDARIARLREIERILDISHDRTLTEDGLRKAIRSGLRRVQDELKIERGNHRVIEAKELVATGDIEEAIRRFR